jgi:hypothetical protein
MAEPDRSLEFGSSAACNRSLALNVDMISRSGRHKVNLVGHEWLPKRRMLPAFLTKQ